jgi:hypothetical protein
MAFDANFYRQWLQRDPLAVCSTTRRLRALSLIDVRLQDAPTEDSSVSISHGETLDMEPSVHAIRAALAELDVVRVPAFE